jgi:hypothetical protein
MRLRKWVSRNGLWIVLMLLAPIAGGLTSYVVLTWLSSVDGAPRPPAERVDAGPAVPTPRTGWTIEEAEAFHEYPVLWLGESFDAMPVTGITRLQSSEPPGVPAPDTDMVTVVYGDCTPAGTPPTCVPPVQIVSTPYCLRPQSLAAPEVLAGEPFELRGAVAQWVGPGHATLVLYGGQSTVTIIATAGEDTALEVASRVHSLNGLPPLSPSERIGTVAASCP